MKFGDTEEHIRIFNNILICIYFNYKFHHESRMKDSHTRLILWYFSIIWMSQTLIIRRVSLWTVSLHIMSEAIAARV